MPRAPLIHPGVLLGHLIEEQVYLRCWGNVGATLVDCDHSASWPGADLAREFGPETPVADHLRRLRCSKCGNRGNMSFTRIPQATYRK